MNDQEYNRLYQEMVEREFIKWLDGQMEHQKKVFDNLAGKGQTHTRNRVDAYINALQSAKSKYCEIEINETKPAPDPWTTITADPATLPEEYQRVIVAFKLRRPLNADDCLDAIPGHLGRDGIWFTYGRENIEDANDADVYAWQPWPTPPPWRKPNDVP